MMKGKKLLIKWKHIKPLRQDRILRVRAADGFVEASSSLSPGSEVQAAVFSEENNGEEMAAAICSRGRDGEVVEIIDVAELMKGLEEDAELTGSDCYDGDNKENIGPALCFLGFDKLEDLAAFVEKPKFDKSDGGIGVGSRIPFAEPDFVSAALLRPNPDTTFDLAAKEGSVGDKVPLLAFQERCPPGGSDSVIFYTTSLRGIRKTYEDCYSMRLILDGFRIKYYTRDVSMHAGYKEELRKILNGTNSLAVPPKLFIRGRYIGGAAEVMSLHKHGRLRPLFLGVPADDTRGQCNHCKGIGFVLCSKCSGSHKISAANRSQNVCPECNENGLAICRTCGVKD